jgi:hypothetical protein
MRSRPESSVPQIGQQIFPEASQSASLTSKTLPHTVHLYIAMTHPSVSFEQQRDFLLCKRVQYPRLAVLPHSQK